jgi:hypothetical protein
MNTALIRPRAAGTRLDLETFAAAAGLHPEFVLRLVSLGLIEAGSGSAPQGRLERRLSLDPGQDPATGSDPGATGELWFSPAQLAVAARIQRLRSGLSLNYAALGLVIDLLDRVSELESALRKAQRGAQRGESAWTRTV